MARLIKEWMKAKKGICSSDCQCLTITGWKCYAEENLCNCGDWGITPPVPPVPGFTYTLEKTSTRWWTVTYTATKTPYGESTPVGVYKVQVEYEEHQWEPYINAGKVWDCTSDCVWREGFYSEDISVYVNKAELALADWTQEAFESVYNAFVELDTLDPHHIYHLTYSEYDDDESYRSYNKSTDSWDSDNDGEYWLIFDKQDWVITWARMTDNISSFEWLPINLETATNFAERSAQALSIWTQTAFKWIYEEAEALYDSLQ